MSLSCLICLWLITCILAQLYCHTYRKSPYAFSGRIHTTVYQAVFTLNPLSAKASHSLVKLIVLHFQGLRPTFLLPPFYESVRRSCLQRSPCHGVSTATNTSTYFRFPTNVRLNAYDVRHPLLCCVAYVQ